MEAISEREALGPRERTRWVDLQGRSDQELQRRIDTLEEAIRAQAGAIVMIKWNPLGSASGYWASVLYRLPPPVPFLPQCAER